jgi:cobaltochelatase CobN
MHLLPTQSRSLDEAEIAVDLAQTPADFVFLSFSDSDLAAVTAAAQSRGDGSMSVRLASLATLKHPYSIDLYVEKVIARSRFVLVRLLGGLDYWRYGVEELSRAARRHGVLLAIIPGDGCVDPRLEKASTAPAADLREIFARFQSGGAANIEALLDWIEARIDGPAVWRARHAVAAAALFEAARRAPPSALGRSLIIFYRAYMLAGDTTPITALADALAANGLDVEAVFVTSLKDGEAIDFMRTSIRRAKPDVILNATAFSARLDDGASVLDEADAPVLQAIFSGASETKWRTDPRGLGAADLAMNVVLPEMDGRLVTRAIAFKAEAPHRPELQFTPLTHEALPSRIKFVADLAARWVHLRKTPAHARKIACILSDYPGKAGRGGYAVGLDTTQSVAAIAGMLSAEGYSIGALPDADELMARLETEASERLSLADYEEALPDMPPAFVDTVSAAWGAPEADPAACGGFFSFSILRAENFCLALQPDRGSALDRKAQYHDGALAPRHAYVAFYVWLRRVAKIDAMIHCGAHGTLEWLPGKAAALSESCAPEAVLGPMPVIYPFIVNNPGEAAQAKRRLGAAIIGHLTPPLMQAGAHGAALEIEALLDEYASAEMLDPKRARLLARAIFERAVETGLAQDCGLQDDDDPINALQRLDAWLCDLKDMRVGDGLHVFGAPPQGALREATLACLLDASAGADVRAGTAAALDRCGDGERSGLIAALDGRFVAPGPGGAPSRGRIDVLPTGRNLYGVDPRAIPTRTAWEIGQRAAGEVLDRHAQDHGEWPKRIVMDLWASATMRTGGDDLAHALALIGARPVWDAASSRVTGFEITPLAKLGRPRVDVTLRISGLFRDVFPAQISLFDQASRAISEADEDDDENPIAAARRATGETPPRIFGAAPSAYGLGLSRALGADGAATREILGQMYLDTASHAYGARGEGTPSGEFPARIASADAMIHAQDQTEQDLLESDATVDHAGGFSAAAQMLGNDAPVYHVETTRPGAIKVRTLPEEVARLVRGRAGNPRWIKGQMRHGHRGCAEIAETVDHLFALAVLTDAVANHHFELLFEATCGDLEVRDFLIKANPKAALSIVARFEEAARRGFWRSRRNSSHDALASMRERLAC